MAAGFFLPRGVIIFWVVVITVVAGGAAYLQHLGPPVQHQAAAARPAAPARVAVIISDLGGDDTLSRLAAGLPPAFTLALSPYGPHVQAAAQALAKGHEIILLLPMPGLIAAAPVRQNQAMLDWSFTQFQGFDGATDAYGPALGGGFMGDEMAKAWLMGNLARKGLFFIDGNQAAGPPPFVWGRAADVVMDGTQPDREVVLLALLAGQAQSRHSALGIVLNPTPESMQMLADWSNSLVDENIQLVPANALVLPPRDTLAAAGAAP